MADERNTTDRIEAALLNLPKPVLPAVALVAIVVLGFLRGPGASVLGLAALALVGAIAVLWASVRTLFGDAPVSLDSALALGSAMAEDERKRAVLRALKELEAEHALGKITDDDFRDLRAKYRAEAKRILQDIDAKMEPARKRAEELVAAELSGDSTKKRKKKSSANGAKAEAKADGQACPACRTQNDADAAFCKKCGERLQAPSEASA